MAGWWERLRQGLSRTREGLGDRIRQLGGQRLDEGFWDDLEASLYEADLGVAAVEDLLERLRSTARYAHPQTTDDALSLVKEAMQELLAQPSDPWQIGGDRPEIWVMVGVNGTGKTTTAGKMAFGLAKRGLRPILGAADTFRAAATEQLVEWGHRAGVEVIRQPSGADPAAVAFDTVRAAVARRLDVAIIDTAGRLHNKANLMQELGKVIRVVQRERAGAPQQCWLVMDATTGQNGLAQARVFTETAPVSGIVLTKLDGTAKGGIVFAIQRELGIPVRWVGVGEHIDDLMPFNRAAYVDAILGRDVDNPQDVE